MVDGKITFGAGSTVPTLEASIVEIPTSAKLDGEAEAETEDIKPDLPLPDEVVEITLVKSEPVKPIPKEPEACQLPTSLFIGDLRLTSLKARLSSLTKPIPAEFAGEGILICGPGVKRRLGDELKEEGGKEGEMVVVRKTREGRIVLEGSVGRTWFDVKRELYGSYAVVGTA